MPVKELTSFKTNDNDTQQIQQIRDDDITPPHKSYLSVVNESVKITETIEKTASFCDECSFETKSVDNLIQPIKTNHKAKLSVDFESMALKRIDQISEKSELSSSSSRDDTGTPFNNISTKKNKKYFNFLNTFQENIPSPELEKKSCPMIRIDITNNYVNNNLQAFKTPTEEVQSENWFFKGIYNLLGCGCGGGTDKR